MSTRSCLLLCAGWPAPDPPQAFLDLGAGTLLPMHWGTFDLTDDPLDLPPQELVAEVKRRGGDLNRIRVMAVGERWKVPEAK